MSAPHTSCRYAVGVHHGAPGTEPRTFIGAVHALNEDGHQVLVSQVTERDRPGDDPMTVYALPQWMDAQHLQAMAPNLGEARKVLRALLAAGPQ